MEPTTNDDGSYRLSTSFTGAPLSAAVYCEDSEKVQFLLKRGADRGIESWEGFRPLQMAVGCNLHEIAEILLSEYIR